MMRSEWASRLISGQLCLVLSTARINLRKFCAVRRWGDLRKSTTLQRSFATDLLRRFSAEWLIGFFDISY
jgi:hypothetical protein